MLGLELEKDFSRSNVKSTRSCKIGELTKCVVLSFVMIY